MKATVTLKVKLETTEQAAQSLSETQKAYAIALNHTSDVAFEKKVFNSVALHHVTYQDVRKLTKLPANLVCSARCIVAEAYKRDKAIHHRWKDTPAMRYDARTLTVKINQEYATLTTLAGRIRVNLILSGYHGQYLDGTWEIEPTGAVSRKGQIWYLHLIVTKDIPDSQSDRAIGVDSGIVRIATTSTGKVFKGGIIKHIRERRFKQRRLIHHGWPFSSLFSKIGHVASKHGIKIESADARNTSKTCHKCGHCDSANRKSQSVFECVRCGHKSNADFNASLNVRDRRAFHGCESVTTRSGSAASGRAKKAALL